MRPLVLLLVLLPLAIGAIAAFAWMRAGTDRYAALEQEGLALARVLRATAHEAAARLASAEASLADRLTAVARRADDAIARTRAPAGTVLAQIGEEERIGRIFLFDASRRQIAHAQWPAPIRGSGDGLLKPERKLAIEWRDAAKAVASLQPGAGEVVVEGLRPNVFGTRERFGVVYGRRDGGTLLLRASAAEISRLREQFGVQPVMERVAAVPGVADVRIGLESQPVPPPYGSFEFDGPFLHTLLPVKLGTQTYTIDVKLSRAAADEAVADSRRQILLGALLALALALGAGTMLLVRETAVRRAESEAAARIEEERRLAEMGALAGLVTHEVSNPLNAIRVALGVLEDQPEGTGRKDVIRIMKEEVERMRHTLEGYMALAGSDSRVRNPVSPDLLQSVRHRVAADALRKGVTVRIDVEPGAPAALGDAIVLEQALSNLARNAVQAAPREGTVALRWSRAHGMASITVADDGPGFPPERDALLKLGGAHRPGGHGLGLPLAKRFVESHGGRMVLADADGGGAVVRVTLPAAEEDDGADA